MSGELAKGNWELSRCCFVALPPGLLALRTSFTCGALFCCGGAGKESSSLLCSLSGCIRLGL